VTFVSFAHKFYTHKLKHSNYSRFLGPKCVKAFKRENRRRDKPKTSVFSSNKKSSRGKCTSRSTSIYRVGIIYSLACVEIWRWLLALIPTGDYGMRGTGVVVFRCVCSGLKQKCALPDINPTVSPPDNVFVCNILLVHHSSKKCLELSAWQLSNEF